MEKGYFNLNKESLNKLFPFFIELNEDLKIVACGNSIKKILGDVTGELFGDIFEIVRPKFDFENSYESFIKNTNKLIIFQTKKTTFLHKFKGDFFIEDAENKLFILSSPWLINASELKPYNLELNDFAIHDALPDQIQLLSSMEIINNDFKIINEQLTENQNKLIEKSEFIEEIALLPDQNPNPTFRIKFNGEIKYANPSAHKIFGNVQEWFDLDIKQILIKKNKTIISEEQLIHNDNYYSAIFVPILEKEYFNIYFINNTKTVKYEKNLITTNSRLDKLINNIGVGILVENANRQILLTNTNFCSLFSINAEPSMLVGADCTNSAEESQALFINEQEFVARIDEIISNKLPVFGDILYLKDGRILERDFIPLYDHNEYSGHIWKYQDITQVIHTKESLKRVDEKYRRIIENFQLGLIEVDLNEVITKVFPSFTDLTGYSEDELLGKNARMLLSDNGRESNLLDEHNEKRKEGKATVYEVQIQVKNGEKKWIILSGAPIYDEKEEVVGSIGIHFDITARKNMENDLKIAKEQAYTYIKAKEAFIAKISHEIRTPMNVILGMSNLLKDSVKETNDANLVDAIKTSGENLLNIINNILDFSDLNREEFSLSEEFFNLNDLLEHLNLFFTQAAQKKKLKWEIILDSNIVPIIKGDKVKLNQVLVNLINNAIKFTNEGSVQLKISLLNKSTSSQQIRFEIIDTGIGISSSFNDRIFTDFSQESKEISSKFGGTGLGLAISNKIISNMGSMIQFNSEKLKGSNFFFDLNLQIGQSEKESQQTAKVELSNSISIAIAEDNPLNQLLLQSIFNKAQLHFTIVSNGKELIDLLSNESYDVVLLDIQMPVMDGIETIKAIRNDCKNNIPVIALTANASQEDKEHYLEIGMSGVISKPFIQEELFGLINECVEHNIGNPTVNFKLTKNNMIYSMDNILKICDGDQAFLTELVKTLVENTTRLVAKIEEDAQLGDTKSVAFSAHQLKSTLRSIEAHETLELVLEIEAICAQNVNTKKLIELTNFLNHKITPILQSINETYLSSPPSKQ
ncbi:MAG: PAS domain S-box protein [Crocinitomicaceae bacterium]|nr:PAS domain S-box protein [Crocinitomicaceae bacterium]